VLPGASTAAACEIAEAVRAAVEACVSPDDVSVDVSTVTASIGVATFPDHARDAEQLLRGGSGDVPGHIRTQERRGSVVHGAIDA